MLYIEDNTELMESDRKYEAKVTFFKEVEEFLGGGWGFDMVESAKFRHHYRPVFFLAQDRMTLTVIFDEARSTYTIHADIKGSEFVGERKVAEINISSKKTSERFAKDLNRRIMPDLLKTHGEVMALEAVAKDNRADFNAKIKLLLEFPDVKVDTSGRHSKRGVLVEVGDSWFDFNLFRSGGVWKIHGNMSLYFEDFLGLVEFLNKTEREV